jgi:hypothetical protein
MWQPGLHHSRQEGAILAGALRGIVGLAELFFLSSPPSLSIATATSDDLEFYPPKLVFLSVKLFSKVYSSSSPT